MHPTFNFESFPELETERLLLRKMTPRDAQAIFAIRGDFEVTKYNIGRSYERIEQAYGLIEAMTYSYAEGADIRWGITLKGKDTVIGMAGYNYWDQENRRASIGYDLRRSQWGRGIMPEALGAIIRFGFERMALNRIEADASILNTASIRVLEKVGFKQEGVQREQYFEDGEYYDLVLFSLLRREYEAR